MYPLKAILKDIPNLEIVAWPGKYAQKNAYLNFTERYKNKVKWGAFIDADEFIVSRKGNIKENLAVHANFGGIGLSWVMFGSNNLKDNTGSQIYAFTKRSHYTFPPNAHIKTIAQLALVETYLTPHNFSYTPPYFCANELGHPINGPFSNFTNQFIYINHYYTRSYNEYMWKLTKGRADGPYGRAPFEHYDKNDVEDFTLVEIYNKLKAAAKR